ncbi:hypothetical protein ACFWFI_28550 [Streptomyces sp. NPDC060209]|uniref:hypothetical protein n=1 Tax=Streptomyces sp. NPDC060209 TaxID=3347073 RepID=UPI0036588475
MTAVRDEDGALRDPARCLEPDGSAGQRTRQLAGQVHDNGEIALDVGLVRGRRRAPICAPAAPGVAEARGVNPESGVAGPEKTRVLPQAQRRQRPPALPRGSWLAASGSRRKSMILAVGSSIGGELARAGSDNGRRRS